MPTTKTPAKKATAAKATPRVAPAAQPKQHRHFTGVVVTAPGQKTISVRVETRRENLKYRKQYTVSRKYAVHDETNQAKVGQVVKFEECRPLSRTKRWRLVTAA